MKKNKIVFWWVTVFLLLLVGEALAQEEIYVSVPAHIYPGEMIQIKHKWSRDKRSTVFPLPNQ